MLRDRAGIADAGRVIAGRYRIDREVGAGGMGSVFAGFDLRLERPVAVKMIRGLSGEEARFRFEREARAVAQVRSPHAVAVYDVGSEGEDAYIVQELLVGEDLYALLDREGPLDPRRVVRLAVQVCEALSAIHGPGFIHRDLVGAPDVHLQDAGLG